MLSSFPRSLSWLGRRWKPLNFTNPNFLGFGSTSTAWLTRDLSTVNGRRYAILKILIQSSYMNRQRDDELKIYQHMGQHSNKHPGQDAVRTLLDTLHIDRPDDKHRCLVPPPLFESVLTFLRRNPVERLPSAVLASLSHAFAFTDLKADNIMLGIEDDSIYDKLEKIEIEDPIPRKEAAEGRLIYMSREMPRPKRVGHPVLCDFGSAIFGDNYREEFAQPNICRAPEVIISISWTYSIWDMYEGEGLFRGYDPEFGEYRSRKHLAEMINLLGPPPPEFIAEGRRKDEFFSSEDQVPLHQVPLEERETTLKGEEDREAFLRLMRKMLQ
ncbi:kinase-like domain-containing protein [Aspergillus stella-maris]|uniref:kinase-like domain-containing protein n=1 Tax=Aspergillus stella-maris TaxID=1810926 RepID=UPI003CCD042D